MKIINLTQHAATPDQILAGVVDIQGDAGAAMRQLMTFNSIPYKDDLMYAAETIAAIAAMYDISDSGDGEIYPSSAMIGGAPFFMSALESALVAVGILPVYAFSTRDSVEKIVGGAVVKTAVFKHIGFVSFCE